MPQDIKDQTIAVLGCAVSGMAAARLARKHGARVLVLDTGESPALDARKAELAGLGIETILGREALAPRESVDLAVLSPGLDPSWELPQAFSTKGVPCISELEFASRFNTKPIIAITGTNGKTTTTELVERIILSTGRKTQAGANYGVAFSELLEKEVPVDIQTLEVSSFQLELIESFHANVAVWLNFAADHLDRHPSLEAYRAAKLRIFENQTSEDTAVINGGEPIPATKAKVVTFSAYAGGTDYHFSNGTIYHHETPLLPLAETKLRGLHNVENMMAAMAVCRAVGIDHEAMLPALKSYAPAPHRCEYVATVQGREFINDSKATNLHATESALRGMPEKVVLIAGGKQKGLDYTPMREIVKQKTTAVFTIGEIRDQLAQTLRDTVPVTPCATLESAVINALEAAQQGQIVLFSPGTSSFDMFTGYDHRGNTFKSIVIQLTTP